MNKILKKFLCKYFSFGEEKRVTLFSLLAWFIFYIIIILFLYGSIYSMNVASSEAYDCVRGVPCFEDTDTASHIIIVSIGCILFTCIIMTLLLFYNIFEKILMFFVIIIGYIITPICETIYRLLSVEITKCEREDIPEKEQNEQQK